MAAAAPITDPVTVPEPKPLTTLTVLRRMAVRFRPYRVQTAGSVLMIVVSVALSTGAPLLLKRVIDVALPQHDTRLLAFLCGLMLVVGLVASLLTVAQTALTNWIGQRVSARLRVEVYDHAHAQPLGFYRDQGQAQIQTRLVSDIDGVDRFLTGTVQQSLASLTTLVAAGAAMVVISWPLALVCVFLAGLLSLFNNRFARRRRELARRRQQLLTTVLRYVAEDLSLPGVLLGRTLRRTGGQRQRFVAVSDEIRQVTFRQRIAGVSAFTLIGGSFACVPPLIYLAYGAFTPKVSVGAVVVLVMLQSKLAQPIQSLLRLSGGLQTSVAMFERVLEYLDMPVDEITPAPLPAGAPRGAPQVRLRGVGYRYPGAAAPSLTDVDLDFPAGSVTVLTGHSGSGKSTLGLLLAGLLAPDSGSAQLDGRGGAGEFRAAATLVPQQTALLHGTAWDNLCYGRTDVSRQDVDRAVRAVRLDAVIAGLPQGADTSLGADGLNLSGGERQRLGIARALLADCRMLVVDEATSSLDHHTADRVSAALREHCRDRTLVLIAHRLPRLEPEDRVVVLDRGRIAEQGTHAELSGSGGAYAGLLAAQLPAGPPRHGAAAQQPRRPRKPQQPSALTSGPP